MKEALGSRIASYVTDKQVIGIGTGSTVDVAISFIGERIKQENLEVYALVTSVATSLKCEQVGIKVLDPLSHKDNVEFCFDGADEVDSRGRAIKGKGAALLLEKIVASRADKFIIIADETKFVQNLGQKTKVPIEIVPESFHYCVKELRQFGAREVNLRLGGSAKYGPVVTDKGNFIIDVNFNSIEDNLEKELKKIVGVIESGLFLCQTSEILLGFADRVECITC
jgi:ribose 5-phosphate isomerase A